MDFATLVLIIALGNGATLESEHSVMPADLCTDAATRIVALNTGKADKGQGDVIDAHCVPFHVPGKAGNFAHYAKREWPVSSMGKAHGLAWDSARQKIVNFE